MTLWVSPPGWPEYSLSQDGRVRSCKNGKVREKKWTINAAGYLVTNFSRNGVLHYQYAHVLMLETFIGPRPYGMEARHLNGSPSDARLCNLAWGTPSQNNVDKIVSGTYSKVLTKDQVLELRSRSRFPGCQAKWAKEFGISPSYVGLILKGKAWKALCNQLHG